MYCRKCGALIYDGEDRCPVCNERVVSTPKQDSILSKKNLNFKGKEFRLITFFKGIKMSRKQGVFVIAVCAVIIAIPVIMKMNCNELGCSTIISRGNYCSSHVCFSDGCKEKSESGSYFCWLHSEIIEEQKVANLEISSVYVTTNSVSTIAKGTITNEGYSTYEFVQVKGSFTNSNGEVIDTGSTYAVGSEGLGPGESAEFLIYIDKNYQVKDCNVTIYDYSE